MAVTSEEHGVSDFALDARAGQLEGVVLRRGILATPATKSFPE